MQSLCQCNIARESKIYRGKHLKVSELSGMLSKATTLLRKSATDYADFNPLNPSNPRLALFQNWSSQPVFDPQSRHTLKLGFVIRNQPDSQTKGMCRNQHVE